MQQGAIGERQDSEDSIRPKGEHHSLRADSGLHPPDYGPLGARLDSLLLQLHWIPPAIGERDGEFALLPGPLEHAARQSQWLGPAGRHGRQMYRHAARWSGRGGPRRCSNTHPGVHGRGATRRHPGVRAPCAYGAHERQGNNGERGARHLPLLHSVSPSGSPSRTCGRIAAALLSPSSRSRGRTSAAAAAASAAVLGHRTLSSGRGSASGAALVLSDRLSDWQPSRAFARGTHGPTTSAADAHLSGCVAAEMRAGQGRHRSATGDRTNVHRPDRSAGLESADGIPTGDQVLAQVTGR